MMRLAFFVQMIDPNDTIRGFIPGWVSALAKEVDELVVISQEINCDDVEQLGPNVRTFTLGKEQGKGKISQFLTLASILSDPSKGGRVDALLTHMNPTYTLACSFFMKMRGIPLFTWYAHKEVSWRLKWAERLSTLCFSASEESFRLASNKIRIMGHGIDLTHFLEDPSRLFQQKKVLKLISACRLSPVKGLDLLLTALKELQGEWTLDIAGDAPKSDQEHYAEKLKAICPDKRITWHGPVPYVDMPQFLSKGEVYVNLSKTGSLDKGLLEALASGLTVLTSNEAFKDFLKGTEKRTYLENVTQESLVKRLKEFQKTPRDVLRQDQILLCTRLKKEHNLESFAKKIVSEMKCVL